VSTAVSGLTAVNLSGLTSETTVPIAFGPDMSMRKNQVTAGLFAVV